eukprot:6532669-Pyramimonas_sp.AAC.1
MIWWNDARKRVGGLNYHPYERSIINTTDTEDITKVISLELIGYGHLLPSYISTTDLPTFRYLSHVVERAPEPSRLTRR